MADNKTICVNGELRPGDLVLSTPDEAYACLVGTVHSVEKFGTAGHESGNETDDVYVNFSDTDYSEQRTDEIAERISGFYHRPMVFDECPIDYVIMAPDTLIRITGIGREELAEILDSEEKAITYCDRVFTEMAAHETPGYKDPEILLRARLDENYEEYRRDMTDLSKEELFGSAAEIAAVEMAHDYLTQQHDFTEPEAVFLLKFENPLQVAADRFEVQLFDISAEVNAIFADQERTLKSGYALSADKYKTAPEPQSKSGISTEKPSVMEQIRRARSEAKDNPAPHKENPAKDKGREL